VIRADSGQIKVKRNFRLKSLSDKKIRQLLKRFAWIYAVCLCIPWISAVLTTKAQGQTLIIGIWPAASLFYFLAYRHLANFDLRSIAILLLAITVVVPLLEPCIH